MAENEDETIIDRILEGDVNAYRQLVDRHQGFVYSVLGKALPTGSIDEVAHEVFVQAFRSLPTFRRNCPFKYWLSAIAIRTAALYWRRKSRADRILPESSITKEGKSLLETALSAHSFNAYLESSAAAGAAETVAAALAMLDPLDRALLTLLYIEDRAVKEVAEHLQISSANVRVRSFRAKRRLKAAIEQLIPGGPA